MKKLINSLLATGSVYLMTFGTQALAACDKTANPGCVDLVDPAPGATVSTYIISITDWVLNITGAIAVLFIIWGGILYVTSSGNKDRADQAKQTLTYAVIGLIVVVLSKVIVSLVTTGLPKIF